MPIVLALLGALVYGTADFAGGIASRRAPALAVVFSGQVASLALLAVALVVLPGRLDPGSVAWGAAAGAVGGFSLLVFYRTLSLGSMTVVAPLTAVMSAVVPVVGGLVLGERPSLLALLGVLLALGAVLLVSAEGGRLPRPAALRGPGPTLAGSDATRSGGTAVRVGIVLGSLGAGTGFGLLFVLLSRAAPDSGFWPVLGARAASLMLLALVAVVARRSLVPRGAPAALVLVAGLGDMTANMLFVVASRSGLLSITGVLIALYPAGTVLLAVLVLKERLAPAQLAGLALAGGGVALIALA